MSWATHVLQWQFQYEAMRRLGANHQKLPQFGLWTATRPYEGGITSNRGSERRGEFVPRPCTHRPSRAGSWLRRKALNIPKKKRNG